MSGYLASRIKPQFYLDSVALMRMSRALAAGDGIHDAAMMMATPANIASIAPIQPLARVIWLFRFVLIPQNVRQRLLPRLRHRSPSRKRLQVESNGALEVFGMLYKIIQMLA